MHYTVRHVTCFTYDAPITESVMEIRMQPRSELCQRCLRFELTITPRVHIFAYSDPLGNMVHHFDIPGEHSWLTVSAEAIVEFVAFPDAPEALPTHGWEQVDAMVAEGDYWDMLHESPFTRQTPALTELATSLDLDRRDDPLTTLRRISRGIHEGFAYVPRATRVDSPIDEALTNRRGVCQDFAHIMIALVRPLGIPCRYVSGYLFHGAEDRSVEGATHAWVEALLPGAGWVGIDPTNNVFAGERHIRIAIGRDYADVPPARGVYKGHAASELAVGVQVSKADLPSSSLDLIPMMTWASPTMPSSDASRDQQLQQLQQQQQ